MMVKNSRYVALSSELQCQLYCKRPDSSSKDWFLIQIPCVLIALGLQQISIGRLKPICFLFAVWCQ